MKYLKEFIRPALLGVAISGIMIIVMLKVTMDLQWLLFLGSVLYFTAGTLTPGSGYAVFAKALLVNLFYALPFVLLVLPQLPGLWYFILIYIVFAWSGMLFSKYRRPISIFLLGVSAITVVLAVYVLPKNLESSLTSQRNDAIPSWELAMVSGEAISTEELKGKVLVFDFFGTWCKPCIKELKVLDAVREKFETVEDVRFFVINADIGGDTPEKFQQFINDSDYGFGYAYDHGSALYKELDLESKGLPTLLVVDKQGTITWMHVGYNSAETGFESTLVSVIEDLK